MAKNKKAKFEETEEPKDMFGNPIDGKVIGKTNVDVSMPEIVDSVEIRFDDKDFILKKGEVKGLGSSLEEAIKSFKKAWQKERV